MTDPTPDFDTVAPEFDQEASAGVKDPPRTIWGTLVELGPGLIIAGSIVGSGELIATTKAGAQAGIALLWLIIFGCVIKVFVQVELGRYSISHGQTTLNALNGLPGKIGPVNYILWFFMIMMAASTLQQGGIVGGVGQAMAIAFPITGDYRDAVLIPDANEVQEYVDWRMNQEQVAATGRPHSEDPRLTQGMERIGAQLTALGTAGEEAIAVVNRGDADELKATFSPWTLDDRLWATLATIITILVLYNGRYGLLQNISAVLVVAFTFVTVGNVVALQTTEQFSLSAEEFWRGLSFSLPGGSDRWDSVATALAAFGIIGVGAVELIVYPYWCLEKGYGRFTGKRSDDPAWAERARGWLRVMHWDAFMSMVVYTIATSAFFIMGAVVLYREGRDPDEMRMVPTLASAYVPVFGEYAKWLFLLGAIAVLYSTFLIANAGHARLFADFFKIAGWINRDSQKTHDRTVSALCVVLPAISLALFWGGVNPVTAVLTAGFTQAIMLPLLGIAAIYYRRTATDPRLQPSKVWDLFLILSTVSLIIVASWGFYTHVVKAGKEINKWMGSEVTAPEQPGGSAVE